MHLSFRQSLETITVQTAALADGNADPRQAGQRLGRIDGQLQDHLHGQYGIEDRLYIPSIARLDQDLSAGFDLLERNNHASDAQLAILANQANAVPRLLSQGKLARGEAAAFDGVLAGLDRFVDRHLIDEEDLIVPVLLHHGERALD